MQIQSWQLSLMLTKCPSHWAKDLSFLLLHIFSPGRVCFLLESWPGLRSEARASLSRVDPI